MTSAAGMGRFRSILFDSLDSTNAEARRLAEQGEGDGLLICAAEQTAGRGRYRRDWQSPPGNLYCSFLLRPDCSLGVATQLGFVASLAVAETMDAVLAQPGAARCKWPNDVLVQGRKIAGILLESAAYPDGRTDWMIVGIGINVCSHPSGLPACYAATCLVAEGASTVSRDGVRERLAECLAERIDQWRDSGFPPIRRAWLARAFGLHKPIRVSLTAEMVEGTFADLDDTGALLVATPSGMRTIIAGDVFVGEA
jgi:BirA family biotin operon repressor/biotin-[acetyl-CoA-carboxylase] ligase